MTIATTRSIFSSYRFWVPVAAVLGLAACGQEPAPKAPLGTAKSGPTAAAKPPVEPKGVPASVPEGKKASASDSDRTLARRVKDALLARPDLKAHGIDITAVDGAVTLFGTADSLASRKMAGDIASGIEGVKSVENKLAVASGS
jgi:hypothetical protein